MHAVSQLNISMQGVADLYQDDLPSPLSYTDRAGISKIVLVFPLLGL